MGGLKLSGAVPQQAALRAAVYRAQTRLKTGQADLRQYGSNDRLATDPVLLRAVLGTLLTGFELPTNTLVKLRDLPGATNFIIELLTEAGYGVDTFDTDKDFDGQRFYLMTSWPSLDRRGPAAFARATAQLSRMYAVGRIAPEHARHIEWWAFGEDDIEVAAEVMAHDDGLRDLVIRQEGNRPPWAGEALVVAETLRTQYFRERWLPAITPGQASALITAPTTLLRDVYAALWSQGYAAYHAHVTSCAMG